MQRTTVFKVSSLSDMNKCVFEEEQGEYYPISDSVLSFRCLGLFSFRGLSLMRENVFLKRTFLMRLLNHTKVTPLTMLSTEVSFLQRHTLVTPNSCRLSAAFCLR